MLKTLLLAGAASTFALSAATAQVASPMTETPAATTLPAPDTGVAVDAQTTADTPVAETTMSTQTDATVTTPSADASAAAPAQATAAPAATPAPEGTIAAAVGANADLSTLGSALTAADLTATLGQPGPFTVFAPTNAAFNLIPEATRTQLMDPANKASLATILQFHVVPGNISAAQLREQIAAGGGTASLQTVAGQTLRASLEGEQIVLTGENNSKAYIASADMAQSNGTVHVVNGILVPRLG